MLRASEFDTCNVTIIINFSFLTKVKHQSQRGPIQHNFLIYKIISNVFILIIYIYIYIYILI